MSVTFASGFEAAAVSAGLKSAGKLDLALVVNRGSGQVAAVFTSNRCQANPILWSKEAIKGGIATAIVLNSGGANCYTGSEGFQTTHATAELTAKLLGASASEVLVCSTGLIGEQLNRDRLLAGVEKAVAALGSDEIKGVQASTAIMTTDSRPKRAIREHKAGWKIGGMAKGAGMLAPGLATMLVVITTDAIIESSQLQNCLVESVGLTFNRLDSDGCMSTNDQVTLMASGASGVKPEIQEFQSELTDLCLDLARQLMDDAEGSSHNIFVEVTRAATAEDAEQVGRSIARNNLFKAAIYGNDPNWGRILAAIGTTSATFDPYDIDVSINGIRISTAGGPDRPRTEVDLRPRDVFITVDLKSGSKAATIMTNDLTHSYVTENSAYAS